MEIVNTAEQQATNAALAALAATGNSYALGQLWELNKGLLRSMFWKWYPAHKALADAHGLTADDFEQEGFFAVQHAAQTYDPAAGTFANWLIQTQRRQIQRALTNGHERNVIGEDGKQHKASADPLNHCTSLDLPLDVEDSGSATVGEQQEDPAAAADLQAVEDDLFREQLHDAIEEALAKLSDKEASVIRRRYYQRQTWAEIEEDSGIKTSQGRTTEHSALTKLRRNPVLNRFHEEVITYHSYTGTGFAAWKHGGSVEERLVEYLDSKGAYLYGGAVNAAVQQKEST